MATQAKFTHGGAHSAGIYADLSVDGPVIGTLVAVVDRGQESAQQEDDWQAGPVLRCQTRQRGQEDHGRYSRRSNPKVVSFPVYTRACLR